MAKETALTLRLGTDFSFIYTNKNAAETAIVEMTGWALSFMVKRRVSDADVDALITKTTSAGIVISGTFNSNPSTNTQIATITILDTDTDAIAPQVAHYEIKRTDAGSETPLAYGNMTLIQSLHRT